MARVVLVDRSAASRRLVRSVLECEHDIEIVEEFVDTVGLTQYLLRSMPDLVLIDSHILSQGGIELIESIMSETPLPILLLSELDQDTQASLLLQAMSRGALAVEPKPSVSNVHGGPFLRAAVRRLMRVPVVHHPRSRPLRAPEVRSVIPGTLQKRGPSSSGSPFIDFANRSTEVVGIGASAGGPGVVAEILAALPKEFVACVLVVQHLPVGFADHFASFLRVRIQLPVEVPRDTLEIVPGTVIVAPDDAHLVVGARGRCQSLYSAAVRGHRPSIDLLFESMARFYGAASIGVVLSGIGSDGTAGLRAIRRSGGLTVCQDGESAAVNGMPRAASESGAATFRQTPREIIQTLLRAGSRNRESGGLHGT